MATKTRREGRERRHRRVRGKVAGTADRPRLSVFRSNKGIYAQLIDDSAGTTVAAAGSMESDVRGLKKGEAAARVGSLLAERGTQAGVTTVVFDRGGYRYHGRVRALADAAREGGLQF